VPLTSRTHVVSDRLYRRRERPTNPASLALWIEDQLDEIERSLRLFEDVPQATTIEPAAKKIGLRRYALAPWNPGYGFNRWYTWSGTAWVADAATT